MINESPEREKRYLPTSPFKWTPNNFTPKYVGKEIFDHERLTPRSAKREISLDRIFDRDYWLPPKKEPNNLWGEVIEDDIKKGKMLKRIMRAKRRERKKEDEQQRMKD